jgi:hypothetical protein
MSSSDPLEELQNILRERGIDLKPNNASLIAFPQRVDEELYPGAHIATGEEGAGNIYHHGIVLSNQNVMLIAHFWGPGGSVTAKIQTTNLAAFLAGDPKFAGKITRPLYLISYKNDNDQKRQQTVDRAKEMLENSSAVEYNILTSNCECFAVYCRTGVWISRQVLKAVNGLITSSISQAVTKKKSSCS